MKNMLKLASVLSLGLVALVGCQQPVIVEPIEDPDPLHPFESTKIEKQYDMNGQLPNTIHRNTLYFYDSYESLHRDGSSYNYNFYKDYWCFTEETKAKYDEMTGFDPFENYDEAFFNGHILIFFHMLLPKDAEVYFISYDEETNYDKNYDEIGEFTFKFKFDIVYENEEALTSVPKENYVSTLCFLELPVDNPSEFNKKYTGFNTMTKTNNYSNIQKVLFISWNVFLDLYVEEEPPIETPVE